MSDAYVWGSSTATCAEVRLTHLVGTRRRRVRRAAGSAIRPYLIEGRHASPNQRGATARVELKLDAYEPGEPQRTG